MSKGTPGNSHDLQLKVKRRSEYDRDFFPNRFKILAFENFRKFGGYGNVLYCTASYRMAWDGMVWYGIVWYGMVWYGMVWYGMVWYGMVWYGMVWYGMVWYGMVWYGIV